MIEKASVYQLLGISVVGPFEIYPLSHVNAKALWKSSSGPTTGISLESSWRYHR